MCNCNPISKFDLLIIVEIKKFFNNKLFKAEKFVIFI